jgi:2-polyprenyl-3-methyl-5-hydroxy-6-metoxy-1,4-benzoquinol methylase
MGDRRFTKVKDTDKDWRILGEIDPYWAVITSEQFKKDNLTEESLNTFFQTGEFYIESILEIIHQHLDPTFVMDRVCDFGCGVGRLVIPLSRHCKEILGIDVSPSMLRECEENCQKMKVNNYSLILSENDKLDGLTGKFSLIHSFIVFQHIPVERGIDLIINLKVCLFSLKKIPGSFTPKDFDLSERPVFAVET